jgi:hypothetical protein
MMSWSLNEFLKYLVLETFLRLSKQFWSINPYSGYLFAWVFSVTPDTGGTSKSCL